MENSQATTEVGSFIDEARRLEEDVLYSEKAHFAMATVWSRMHYLLGIPSALFAAAAGASALKQWPEVAAGTAVAAALLTTLMTFLDAEKARSDHHATGIRYNWLRGKLRRLHQIDLKGDRPPSDYRGTLEGLAQEKATIMQSARHIGGLAYRLGKKSVLEQQHAYEVDGRKARAPSSASGGHLHDV
jgi:hypothetical protein